MHWRIGRCDLSAGGPERAEGPLREAVALYRQLGADEAAEAVERLLAPRAG